MMSYEPTKAEIKSAVDAAAAQMAEHERLKEIDGSSQAQVREETLKKIYDSAFAVHYANGRDGSASVLVVDIALGGGLTTDAIYDDYFAPTHTNHDGSQTSVPQVQFEYNQSDNSVRLILSEPDSETFVKDFIRLRASESGRQLADSTENKIRASLSENHTNINTSPPARMISIRLKPALPKELTKLPADQARAIYNGVTREEITAFFTQHYPDEATVISDQHARSGPREDEVAYLLSGKAAEAFMGSRMERSGNSSCRG